MKNIIVILLFLSSLCFSACWKTRNETVDIHIFPYQKSQLCTPAPQNGMVFEGFTLNLGDNIQTAAKALVAAGYNLDSEDCKDGACVRFFSKRSAIKKKQQDTTFQVLRKKLIGDEQFTIYSGADKRIAAAIWESTMADNCEFPPITLSKDRCSTVKETLKSQNIRKYYGETEAIYYYSGIDELIFFSEFAELAVGERNYSFCEVALLEMDKAEKILPKELLPKNIADFYRQGQ